MKFRAAQLILLLIFLASCDTESNQERADEYDRKLDALIAGKLLNYESTSNHSGFYNWLSKGINSGRDQHIALTRFGSWSIVNQTQFLEFSEYIDGKYYGGFPGNFGVAVADAGVDEEFINLYSGSQNEFLRGAIEGITRSNTRIKNIEKARERRSISN